ncbi:hypothetical protein ZWY2020_016761 [Hordeum vulgare]|nr:hypothetical protein ZWY2020_016761 [Hordeum vulgare]
MMRRDEGEREKGIPWRPPSGERNRPPNPSLAAPDDASKPPRLAAVPPHYDAYEERRLAEEVLYLHSLWRSDPPTPTSAPAPPAGGSRPTRARPTNGSVAGSSAPPRSPRDPAPTGPSRPPRPPPRPPHPGPRPPPPPPRPGHSQSRNLPPPHSRSGTPSAPPRSSSPGAAPRTRTATTRMRTGNLSETCNKQTPGGRQAILGTSGACEGGQADDRDGGVAVITICNPPVNSLSIDVLLSLKESYEEALERKDVKAIVVTGKGGKNSGGFDISSFGGLHSGKVEQPKVGATKPSAAAIDGLCLGGGLEVSMACHAGISTPTVN